jgi:DNA uptake protein ComE-like DNA-binding protein
MLASMSPAEPELIDVNRATLVDLLRVPVIDGTVAGLIIDARARHGRFRSLEELGAAAGLDGARLDALREWLGCGP